MVFLKGPDAKYIFFTMFSYKQHFSKVFGDMRDSMYIYEPRISYFLQNKCRFSERYLTYVLLITVENVMLKDDTDHIKWMK
jgi:hypothetical protein